MQKLPKKYYHPKYWGIWLGVGTMKLFILLPYRLQLAIGRLLGTMALPFAKHRKSVCQTNLQICFPHLSQQEIHHLIKSNFQSVGMGMIETAMAWYMPDKRLKNKLTIKNFHLVEHLLDKKVPIILCGFHFTCLEIAGRLLQDKLDYALLYREHKNPLFNHLMYQGRERYTKLQIGRKEMKKFSMALKQKIPVWFAPDQDYGRHRSVFAPFYGTQAATITTLSHLAKRAKLHIIPIAYYRKPDYSGYELHFYPPFKNFPSGDLVTDATQLNEMIESAINQQIDQYLWQHRRFKTRPIGEAKLYPISKRKRKL